MCVRFAFTSIALITTVMVYLSWSCLKSFELLDHGDVNINVRLGRIIYCASDTVLQLGEARSSRVTWFTLSTSIEM